MTEPDDLILVKESLNGNEKAFEKIVDRYQETIFNVALRMVNDLDHAKDITQTVFLKAFEKLGTFKREYKFFSWLYRMVLNESINFIKQRKHFLELDESITCNRGTPEEVYSATELGRTVREVLMELQIDQRTVIILRHFEDLSYREIGHILNLKEKTVKSRLFTARKLLHQAILRRGIRAYD